MMTPHPRLYIRPAMINRCLHPAPGDARAARATKTVDAAARAYLAGPDLAWDPGNGHNAHLIRARIMQTRIVTLLAAWLRSGEERYRTATLRHVEAMAGWEYWSWITWRQGNADPLATFDLSYGENCATLAIAYDLLAPSLAPAEKKLFLDQATGRALASFRRHTDPATPASWMNRPDCNWLPVCAGGGGLLALALADELPDMQMLIDRADKAVTAYLEKVDEFGGGCVEGLAYWNYGMRYAFMFLLSHEAATGRLHPALRLAGVRQTLHFPLDFSPRGVPCGFGDINHPWTPLPFHYAAAERLGEAGLFDELDAARPADKITASCSGPWPLAAELLLLRPQPQTVRLAVRPTPAGPRLRFFPGMDWGCLAGASGQPRLAATIRGGATNGPHNHLDLFSFHLVCDGEALITSVSNSGYVDTTFGDRRFDIWEMRPDAKNVPFIGGVSLSHPASVKTVPIRVGRARGFHLSGPEAIRINLYKKPIVRQLDRLFLILEDKAFLVIDRITLAAPNRLECRFHSFANVEPQTAGARFKGRKARMRLTVAASVPLTLTTATGAPNNPAVKPSTLLRVFARDLVPGFVLVSLFTPGSSPAKAELKSGPRGRYRLHIKGSDFDSSFTLPFLLNPE